MKCKPDLLFRVNFELGFAARLEMGRARQGLSSEEHRGTLAGKSMRLRAGQISPIGLAALAIGIMSPALGLFALWGPMQTAAGPITPLVYLAAAALALPTAISY